MCGIAGMIGPQANARMVSWMVRTQGHRGPDGEGLWSATDVALGHCRLKIIDLSDACRQPMTTDGGRYTIVFNGEIYNFKQIRSALPRTRFRSHTDTEVALYAYAHWGPECLAHFMGMYGLAIWDTKERRL